MSFRRAGRLLGLVAGLATVAALFAAEAGAAGTWTVKAGSAARGTRIAITGRTIGKKPQIHFTDVTTAQRLHCASGTAPGSLKVGRGLSGTAIGTINGPKTTWNTCKGNAGLTFHVTGIGTWNLNATSFAAPVTKGSISNITARVVDPGVCSFTVTGSVGITYNNKTHRLAVPGVKAGLHVSHVTGCFGLIRNRDHAKFHATYALRANKAAFNPITITSR